MAINDFWWHFLSLLWYWGYYCHFYLWASVSLELLANNRKLTPLHRDIVDKHISTRLCPQLPADYCTMRYALQLYLYLYTGYLLESTKPRDLLVTCAGKLGKVHALWGMLTAVLNAKPQLFAHNHQMQSLFLVTIVHGHALLPPGFTEKTCLVCQFLTTGTSFKRGLNLGQCPTDISFWNSRLLCKDRVFFRSYSQQMSSYSYRNFF